MGERQLIDDDGNIDELIQRAFHLFVGKYEEGERYFFF